MSQSSQSTTRDLTTFRHGGDPLQQIRQEFEAVFDRMLSGFGTGAVGRHGGQLFGSSRMPVNVSEDQKSFRVEAELPGLREQDIEVSLLGDNRLSIRARREQQQQQEGQNLLQVESNYGEIQRTLYLPHGIEGDQITANYNNGVLTLTIPKTAESQRQHRRIQVQSGGQTGSGSGSGSR